MKEHYFKTRFSSFVFFRELQLSLIAPLFSGLVVRLATGVLRDPNSWKNLFEVASQINLLEMINQSSKPEDGIGIYEYDNTQGPKCAIACGAGTIYRNYKFLENTTVGSI